MTIAELKELARDADLRELALYRRVAALERERIELVRVVTRALGACTCPCVRPPVPCLNCDAREVLKLVEEMSRDEPS